MKKHGNKHIIGSSIIGKKGHTATSPNVQPPHIEQTNIQQLGTHNLFNTCLHITRTCVNFVLCIGVLFPDTFVEGFRGTPDCTGRSIIDDSMFDSGVYHNIGSNSFFKCKLLQFEQPFSLSVH
jgi:hypothetical protein